MQGCLTIHTYSEEDTRAFGVRLGARVHGGEIIGLCGELGSGKTALVRGVAQGLGVPPEKVRSPSFTLIAEYSGGRLPLYHIDLYRLVPTDVDRLALREYLYGHGVCVVEWFDRLGEEAARLQVDLTFVGENERVLVVTAHGTGYDALLDGLRD
jgi:tRNA threonylcarbamoyladenosine biosynthesis protein TsaE